MIVEHALEAVAHAAAECFCVAVGIGSAGTFIFSCDVTGGVVCDQLVGFVGKLPGDQRIIRPKHIIERFQRIFYCVGVFIAKMITEHPKNDGRIFHY